MTSPSPLPPVPSSNDLELTLPPGGFKDLDDLAAWLRSKSGGLYGHSDDEVVNKFIADTAQDPKVRGKIAAAVKKGWRTGLEDLSPLREGIKGAVKGAVAGSPIVAIPGMIAHEAGAMESATPSLLQPTNPYQGYGEVAGTVAGAVGGPLAVRAAVKSGLAGKIARRIPLIGGPIRDEERLAMAKEQHGLEMERLRKQNVLLDQDLQTKPQLNVQRLEHGEKNIEIAGKRSSLLDQQAARITGMEQRAESRLAIDSERLQIQQDRLRLAERLAGDRRADAMERIRQFNERESRQVRNFQIQQNLQNARFQESLKNQALTHEQRVSAFEARMEANQRAERRFYDALQQRADQFDRGLQFREAQAAESSARASASQQMRQRAFEAQQAAESRQMPQEMNQLFEHLGLDPLKGKKGLMEIQAYEAFKSVRGRGPTTTEALELRKYLEELTSKQLRRSSARIINDVFGGVK